MSTLPSTSQLWSMPTMAAGVVSPIATENKARLPLSTTYTPHPRHLMLMILHVQKYLNTSNVNYT